MVLEVRSRKQSIDNKGLTDISKYYKYLYNKH
ncbi:hypothetical protein HMPREF0662_02191 [Prevotella nigrescens F0103]|nr:hypothetical protein HMPREF0662_02191 [Prevotella nigrescens F0103]